MSTITEKAHQQSLNRAIDYINANLRTPIDLEVLARVSNISKYHFHRIFKAYIGESVAAYITRIRLEKAAQHLQISKMSLAEIATRVGYKSQHSLSKAFKKRFGVSPSKFRNEDLYLSIDKGQQKGGISELTPLFQTIGSFHLMYIRIIAKYGSSKEYDPAWYRLLAYAEEREILHEGTEYIGLSFDDPAITKDKQCRFYACITVDGPLKPEGEFGVLSVNGGKYAIFTHKGPYEGLNKLYQVIYLDWITKNGVRLRKGIPFEKYLNSPDQVAQQELLTEIYIPIE